MSDQYVTGEEFLASLDEDHPRLEGLFSCHAAVYDAFDDVLSALTVMMELEEGSEKLSFAWDVVELVRSKFDDNYYEALNTARDLVEVERGA